MSLAFYVVAFMSVAFHLNSVYLSSVICGSVFFNIGKKSLLKRLNLYLPILLISLINSSSVLGEERWEPSGSFKCLIQPVEEQKFRKLCDPSIIFKQDSIFSASNTLCLKTSKIEKQDISRIFYFHCQYEYNTNKRTFMFFPQNQIFLSLFFLQLDD